MAQDQKEMERTDVSSEASGADRSTSGSLGSVEVLPVKEAAERRVNVKEHVRAGKVIPAHTRAWPKKRGSKQPEGPLPSASARERETLPTSGVESGAAFAPDVGLAPETVGSGTDGTEDDDNPLTADWEWVSVADRLQRRVATSPFRAGLILFLCYFIYRFNGVRILLEFGGIDRR